MLDLGRITHLEIHSQVREASPDLKRAITEGRSTSPVTPECQFHLPGGRAASPKSLFVLARSLDGLTVLMAEGKCAEPFDPRVSLRYTKPSTSKITRSNLKTLQVQTIHYQLMHSSAFVPITAQCFHAARAGLLVHSFSKTGEWLHTNNFAQIFAFMRNPAQLSGRPLRRIDLYSGGHEYGLTLCTEGKNASAADIIKRGLKWNGSGIFNMRNQS
jgi:hypothetical protein